MKTNATQIPAHFINQFDQELLMLLRADVQQQRAKIKNKLINRSTIIFDKELLHIIQQDVACFKSHSNKNNHFAQAS